MKHGEVVSILKDLITKCEKGRDSFRNAAENIQNSEFRRLFNIFSQQRAQFVSELRAELHRLSTGEMAPPTPAEPFDSTTTVKMGGTENESSIISQCEREEEAAVSRYEDAMKADLPLDVQYVLKRQFMDIKDAYDRIRILQRAA
jgi:uncharacterized protein (TIGR02284 family)